MAVQCHRRHKTKPYWHLAIPNLQLKPNLSLLTEMTNTNKFRNIFRGMSNPFTSQTQMLNAAATS